MSVHCTAVFFHSLHIASTILSITRSLLLSPAPLHITFFCSLTWRVPNSPPCHESGLIDDVVQPNNDEKHSWFQKSTLRAPIVQVSSPDTGLLQPGMLRHPIEINHWWERLYPTYWWQVIKLNMKPPKRVEGSPGFAQSLRAVMFASCVYSIETCSAYNNQQFTCRAQRSSCFHTYFCWLSVMWCSC